MPIVKRFTVHDTRSVRLTVARSRCFWPLAIAFPSASPTIPLLNISKATNKMRSKNYELIAPRAVEDRVQKP
jgi:hypothetical protein